MKNNIRYKFFYLMLVISGQQLVIAQELLVNAAFIKIDPKIGKVVHHRVLNNQTLYSIARNYGVNEANIIGVNSALKTNRSELPPVLTIPIAGQQILIRLPLFKNKSEYLPVYYEVQKKENLFRISRIYFDIPTNLLVNRNNLESENLQTGQTLHIGWIKKNFDPLMVLTGQMIDPEKVESDPELSEAKHTLNQRFKLENEGGNLVSKNEVAFWKSSEKTKGMFVMHRHAALHSIIEIKNPMYNATVYAKVVGSIPDHLYAKEIDMVISRDVALALGAVDPKFFVRVRYKSPQTSASR